MRLVLIFLSKSPGNEAHFPKCLPLVSFICLTGINMCFLLPLMTPNVTQVYHMPVYALTGKKCELPMCHVNNSAVRPRGASRSVLFSYSSPVFALPFECGLPLRFDTLENWQSRVLTSQLAVVTLRYWVHLEQQPVVWPVELSCVSTPSAVNTTGTFFTRCETHYGFFFWLCLTVHYPHARAFYG